MLYRIAGSLRFLAEAVLAEASARQVALGFSLGVAIGLIPKANLTAVALIVLLFALRVNIAAGLVAAALFSWIGPLADPVLHLVGQTLLAWGAVQPVLAWLYRLPLVPWTQFNNSVVAGGWLIGMVQLYPTYRLLTPYFGRRLPVWSRQVGRIPVARALLGKETTSSWSAG